MSPSLGTLCGALIVTSAVLVELQPLADNSFLTHLATGRLILDRGSVPSTDPYTFTAHGEPWVVQSWLVSVLYASAEAVGGINAVRAMSGALAGTVAALAWRLLRPVDGLVAKLALGVVFVTAGASLWAERPLMVGLIAFALTVLAAEGRLDPRWLVPLGWVWVNSHGSFPLGLVYLVVLAVGARLDGADGQRELRCLGWAGLGTLVGVVGPLGLRAVLFPLQLLQRQDLLSNVIEWQAPAFTSVSERAFLLQLVAAMVLLVRRPSYRAALPAAVFAAAALLGLRNVSVASIALLPGMATALVGLGSVSSAARPRRGMVLCIGVVALGALLIGARLQGPALRLTAYPVDALAYLEERHVDIREHRLATSELVGNLLTFIYGPGDRVFYDDRFDMFPEKVATAALALGDPGPSLFTVLAGFDIDLVTVPRSTPSAVVLASDPGWRMLYVDEQWVLACRRGAGLGDVVGRC